MEKLIRKFSELTVDELIRTFKESGLPSRNEEEASKLKLKDEEVVRILKYVGGKEGKKGYEYRKLRELVVQCNNSAKVKASVLEASAQYSLTENEYSEYLTASNSLINGPYSHCKSLRKEWIYCANLLLYHAMASNDDLMMVFYAYPIFSWNVQVLNLMKSISEGNIPWFDFILKKLPKMPNVFIIHLRTIALDNLERNLKMAFKFSSPVEFLNKLKTKNEFRVSS